MNISNDLRAFLKQEYILRLIDEDQWEAVYNSYTGDYVGELTEFLMCECNINPLDHMTCVPEHFGYVGLTSISIPDNITTIGDSAFQYCNKLTDISIPNSVTSIGQHAFYYCTSLTSITIPDKVTTISISTFDECKNLTTVKIPSSVTEIEHCAFANCSSLTNISIPEGVTSFGQSVFRNCTNLTTIDIPSSVEDLGRYTFCNSNNIKVINFSGTCEQWRQISLHSDLPSLVRSNIVIHCTDGDLPKPRRRFMERV